MNKLCVCMALALVACGGAKAKTNDVAMAKSDKAAVVELAELQFFMGDDLGMKLHANGHLEMKREEKSTEYHDVGSISADGAVMHDGQQHGTFKADGTFVTMRGEILPFKLEADTLVVGDQKITLDDKGVLQGGNPMPKPLRVEGATTPGLRRTALLVLALILSGTEHMESTQAATPPAPSM